MVDLYPIGQANQVLDDYLFFFLCFFSLRDWLKAHTPEAFEQWKKRFNGNLPWQFCRDVSNRFKHLEVSQPSLALPFTLIREYVTDDQHRISWVHNGTLTSLSSMAIWLNAEMVAFIQENRDLLPPQARGVDLDHDSRN